MSKANKKRKKDSKMKTEEENVEVLMEEQGLSEGQDSTVEEQAEALAATIGNLEEEKRRVEVEDFKDKYLRLLAETENTRRRQQKERQDLMKFAVENLIIDFLHPLDNLENALGATTHVSDEVKNWSVGFEMILGQFRDVLSQHGVKCAGSAKGNKYDPHHHEAVEMVESEEAAEGTILKEFVKEYLIGERTIRPARVTVAKEPVSEEEIVLEETATEDLNKK